MKTCYVTGATGCVGRNLVDELARDGDWDIVILHRKSSDLSRLKDCKVRFQEVDLHDLESVRKALAGGGDVVFHAAANTSEWVKDIPELRKDNVLATRNLAEIALEKGVKRFIFTSTGATYPFHWTNETTAEGIFSGYVRTKRLSELEIYKAVEKGLDAVILRPTIIVGAYDYNSYAQIFSMLKTGGLKVIFPGEIIFCSAKSVARAHIKAFEKGRTAEGYVLGGTYTSWLDFSQRICRMLGQPEPAMATPRWVIVPLAWSLHYLSLLTGRRPPLTPHLLSIVNAPDVPYYEQRKSKIDLDYQSQSLDEMIKDCYDWMVREKRL